MINLRTQGIFKKSYPDGIKTYKLTPNQLIELQQVLLGVAADVIDVLERHQLQYVLYAGSALGAVRHEDFIPWDDDLDIAMPRNDLEKFIDVFDEELSDRYWISTPGVTSGCRAPMTKVLLKGTILRDRNTYDDIKCGVSIDIFPYETVPDNRFLREAFRFRSLAAGLAASCRWFYEDRDMFRAYIGSDKDAKKVVEAKIRIGHVLSMLPLDFWVNHAYKVWGRYKDTNSDTVAVIARWKETIAPREKVFPPTKLRFGRYNWCVPADYDLAMRSFFGDYMTLPPAEERESHGFFEVRLPGWEHSMKPTETES